MAWEGDIFVMDRLLYDPYFYAAMTALGKVLKDVDYLEDRVE